MQVTAPQSGFWIPCRRAQRCCHAKSARRNNVRVRPMNLGRQQAAESGAASAASRPTAEPERREAHGLEGEPQSQPSVAQRTMNRAPDSCRKRRPASQGGKSDSGRGRSRGRAVRSQVAFKLGANEAGKCADGIAILGFDEKGSQMFADNEMVIPKG